MRISFVICTKSTHAHTANDSIQQIGRVMRLSDEIIVIENIQIITRYSHRAIQNIISNKYNIRYISLTSGTLGHSRNIAFRKARGEYLVFVDDDVIIHKDFRKHLVRFVRKHKDAVVYVNPFQPATMNSWSRVACAFWNQELVFKNKSCKILAYPLACSAFRMSFIRNHHILCNETIYTGEDMDILLQINETNGAMYFDPIITNTHRFPTSMKSLIKKYYMYALNYFDLKLLHPKNYLLIDNVYNYLPIMNYILPLNYIVSMKKILRLSIEFIQINRLPVYLFPHVFIVMTTIAVGVYRTKHSANIFL